MKSLRAGLWLPLVVAMVAPLPSRAATGDLLAPVKAQQGLREAQIQRAAGGRVDPRYIDLLLGAGRVDEAAGALARLKGDPRQVAVARARVYLARQDYAAARPLIEDMGVAPALTDAEREVCYAWLFALDDAAEVDRRTRALVLTPGTPARAPDLLAAGRVAYELLNYDRADSCFQRALEQAESHGVAGAAARAAALRGLGQVLHKRRDYDASLARLAESVAIEAGGDNLTALAETLIRLGRTDDAITAGEWAVRLNPYHEFGHYLLGNGYARKNYTELLAAYPQAFADAAGRSALAGADSLLDAGDRPGARVAYAAVMGRHPGWADARVRLASLEFEDGSFDAARDLCFEALRICPEYGRAHATLAKALESQRFLVDVHRAGYETRFAAAPMPDVPGIDRFVLNWKSLSPRHQKRVALSVAPWAHFLPVLTEAGATYYIKPLYMLLSECPGQETLRDQRIGYDSRLWDDVRGCGGFRTVTGVEDVERTIFDRYNTVLHELSHQVQSVLTANQNREIQELYRRAKERDEATHQGFLSRYAGGSVWEYFAEGANALESPRRDAYDPREVVRERLEAIDPDLLGLVQRLFAQTDVTASYVVAFVNAGGDRLERGDVDGALAFVGKALERSPAEETALKAQVEALILKGDGVRALAAAEAALKAHPTSGSVVVSCADAWWRAGRGLDAAIQLLVESGPQVRAEDRYLVNVALGHDCWVLGDAAASLAAYDSVLAYQADNPEALWGRAAALGLAGRWDESFAAYDQAVRVRTGIVGLRCDYACDLLRAGRLEPARAQLDEAALLDAENPTAEALRGWLALDEGRLDGARAHLSRALEWGPWCDLARILKARAARLAGDEAGASAALAPVKERIARGTPPEYIYRKKLAVWESAHELPAIERAMVEEIGKP